MLAALGDAPRTTTCASPQPRSACSTRCSRRSPRRACDAAFARARERAAHVRRASSRATRRRASTASCAATSATASAGSHFLQRFGFGGCLADDMGLGKTVQVLALLESRARARGRATAKRPPGPSLVVVPRSLVFNWKQEAARFTPELRVLDHTGVGRASRRASTSTTTTSSSPPTAPCAATSPRLKDVRVRLRDPRRGAGDQERRAPRRPRRRGCSAATTAWRCSGTPIENHLGELWSLFEFLNPGMLGAAPAFGGRRTAAREPRARRGRRSLARALRPFILRRTKEQVAPELPREDRADPLLRAGARPAAALRRAARPLPRGAARARSGATGSTGRRSRCSRRCCGCARPPATPA